MGSYNYNLYYNSLKPNNENQQKTSFKNQDMDLMNQNFGTLDMNNTNNLTEMMNNLSLEQMNLYSQSPFNNNNNNNINNNNNNLSIFNMNNPMNMND